MSYIYYSHFHHSVGLYQCKVILNNTQNTVSYRYYYRLTFTTSQQKQDECCRETRKTTKYGKESIYITGVYQMKLQ
jgi:hypothetical protein